MANANLCTFVYARTYVSGLNERYIICTYVRSIHRRTKLTMTERETEGERQRERETDDYYACPQTP